MPPEPQNPQMEPPSPLEDAHQGKRRSVVLLIFLGIVFLLLAFGLLFLKSSLDSQNMAQIQTDEFTDWKTYRNESYGFEIKYPPTSTITEETRATCVAKEECLDVLIDLANGQIMKLGLGTAEFGRDLLDPIKKELIVIDGNQYQMWIGSNQYIKVWFGDYSIWLYDDSGVDDLRLFRSTLSTFKFIDS